MSTVLATCGGNLFLVLGTVLFGSLAILLSWVPPRGNWVYLMARAWSRGLLAFSGVQLDVRWTVPVERTRRFIVMSNHQSLYDIPALIAALPIQTRFLAKRSLFRIPIFGWAIKAGGFISVDREDRSRAKESFSEAVRQLRTGTSTVIFPEGTRSLDGRLQPFERGGVLLALKSRIPILPVGIRGSLAVQRRGSRIVRPGKIEVTFGRPIDSGDYTVRTKNELTNSVRQQIARLVGLDH